MESYCKEPPLAPSSLYSFSNSCISPHCSPQTFIINCMTNRVQMPLHHYQIAIPLESVHFLFPSLSPLHQRSVVDRIKMCLSLTHSMYNVKNKLPTSCLWDNKSFKFNPIGKIKDGYLFTWYCIYGSVQDCTLTGVSLDLSFLLVFFSVEDDMVVQDPDNKKECSRRRWFHCEWMFYS